MPLGIVEQHTCKNHRNDGVLRPCDTVIPGAKVYAFGLGHGITSSDVPEEK